MNTLTEIPLDIKYLIIQLLHVDSTATLFSLLHISKLWYMAILGYLSSQNLDFKYLYISVIRENNLSILQWANSYGYQWNSLTCAYVARHGHLGTLQKLREHGCEWNYRVCASAALGGHLEILKWAREQGCEWNHWTCIYAARGGHLEVLKWAREPAIVPGGEVCEWDSRVCSNAAGNGHLEVLKWAIANGCKWDNDVWGFTAIEKRLDVMEWLKLNCTLPPIDYAIETDNLELLQWMHTKNYGMSYICDEAAKQGNLRILKWAKESGYRTDWFAGDNALAYGHLEVLKWLLHDGGGKIFWLICSRDAAKNGHLETLKWGFEYRGNISKWVPPEVCKNAVENDHLDIVIWARENGCIWDKETAKLAQMKWPDLFCLLKVE